jgi:hypothetical protein
MKQLARFATPENKAKHKLFALWDKCCKINLKYHLNIHLLEGI